MNVIPILASACVLISSLPLRAEQGFSDRRMARRSAESALRGLDDHNTVPPLEIYRFARNAGYSDEEIRDGLLQRIHQSDWPREGRAPFFATKAAYAALDLFRGESLVERTVLEAHRPDPEHYLPEYAEIVKRGIMWDAIARFGSDELVVEFKVLEKDHFAKNPQGLRGLDEHVAARHRFHRDRVPEELKPGNRLLTLVAQSAKDRNEKQSGPSRVSRSTLGGMSGILSQWPWLLGLCGLAMAAVGFSKKWRSLCLGGAALIVVSAAFLIFTSR